MSNAIPIFSHTAKSDSFATLAAPMFRPADDRGEVRSATSPVRGFPGFIKRAMDICGSLTALILLSPVIAVVAVLVRLDSNGPILFRQRRLGRGGETFWCLKFRTMVTDAEQRLAALESMNESAGGVLFKIRRDPRITPLGRILRKTSLDELPQLLNILRGEMSLVGPRPLQLRDCQLLEAIDPEGFRRRLSVPQGLTGAWQVGGRSSVDCDGMLKLDIDYAESWSLRLDLAILARTVLVVLTGRGAC